MTVAIPVAKVEVLRGVWLNDDDFQDEWAVTGGTMTTDGENATLTIDTDTVSISKPCNFNSIMHKYAIINCMALSASQWQFKARRASDQQWVTIATFTSAGIKTVDISQLYSGEVDMIGISVSGTVGQSAQYDYVIVASQTLLMPTDDKDILDMRVHLGLVEEVGSFELTMQNFDAKYTGQVAVGNWIKIWASRADASLLKLFTGRVEEVEFDASSTENYLILRGRDRGEELFRRTVTRTYANAKAEEVVKDLIDDFTSLKHVRGTTELVENSDTTYTRLEYENTPLFDILKDIAQSTVKDGVVGFDFRIAWDGKFEFFKRNSKTSPVSLTDRIEVAEYRKDIHRIRNRITAYGAAEKANPNNRDAWTEDLTVGSGQLIYYEDSELYGWWEPVGYCSVAKDSSTRIVGNCCVRLSTTQPVASSVLDWYFATGHLFDSNKYPSLTFQLRRENAPGEVGVKIELMDSNSQKVRRIFRTEPDKWDLQSFSVGEKQDNDWTHDEFNTQAFNWAQIRRIRFEAYFNGNGSGSFWIDNLFFNSKRWESIQEDTASQQAYGLRELVEVDEELHSDNECSLRAQAMISYLKDPAEYITLRSDAVTLQDGRLLPGDVVHVSLPNETIDADYRTLTVEHNLIAKEQTFEITLELGKEPKQLASVMSDLRSKTESLARNKAGPSGVVGTSSGGGGGSGGAPSTATYITVNDETANLPNSMRHVNIAEVEKHTPKLHKDSHKTGGADAFAVNDMLDAVARLKVRKNSGTDVGTRRRLNFIEGANVTLTVADDPTNEEVDVTIAAAGGGTDAWQDNSKLRWFLHPSYYDVTSGSYVTRKPGYWQLSVPPSPVAQYARSDLLPSGLPPILFNKNPEFYMWFYMSDNGASNLLILAISAGNEDVASNKKFGVKVVGSTMYILTSNGTEKATTQVATGIAYGYHRVRVKLTSGIKITVWLDDNVGVDETETAKLPSGQHTSQLIFGQKVNNSGDYSNQHGPVLIMCDK
jgi:hypothetical protein